MISLISFSKGYLDDGEDDIRNRTYNQMFVDLFVNQTFYGYRAESNITFYFPNLYKNQTQSTFLDYINISVYCIKDDQNFSKEINASYYLGSKVNDTNEYFSTRLWDFQDCIIKQRTHQNYQVGFLNFTLSFKLVEYPDIEVFRAFYTQMTYTNTEGCGWGEEELVSSKFMICDQNCLEKQLKPSPNPSSTLKFCITENCIETVDQLDLFEDQDVYLLQELTLDMLKDYYYSDSLIFFYSENGFIRHIHPESKNYSQGKVTYHIKINRAWIDFKFSAILKFQKKESYTFYYIGGNTGIIGCVRDQDLNCINCESICRMNCGEAPKNCVCENNTCNAQNLFTLILILIFLAFV